MRPSLRASGPYDFALEDIIHCLPLLLFNLFRISVSQWLFCENVKVAISSRDPRRSAVLKGSRGRGRRRLGRGERPGEYTGRCDRAGWGQGPRWGGSTERRSEKVSFNLRSARHSSQSGATAWSWKRLLCLQNTKHIAARRGSQGMISACVCAHVHYWSSYGVWIFSFQPLIKANQFVYLYPETSSPLGWICSTKTEDTMTSSTWWKFAPWKQLRCMTKFGDAQALTSLLLRINPPKVISLSEEKEEKILMWFGVGLSITGMWNGAAAERAGWAGELSGGTHLTFVPGSWPLAAADNVLLLMKNPDHVAGPVIHCSTSLATGRH